MLFNSDKLQLTSADVNLASLAYLYIKWRWRQNEELAAPNSSANVYCVKQTVMKLSKCTQTFI